MTVLDEWQGILSKTKSKKQFHPRIVLLCRDFCILILSVTLDKNTFYPGDCIFSSLGKRSWVRSALSSFLYANAFYCSPNQI